jgi:hypothetical protein
MMRVLLERWSGLNWAVAGLLAGLLVSAGQLAWAAPEPQILKSVVERDRERTAQALEFPARPLMRLHS